VRDRPDRDVAVSADGSRAVIPVDYKKGQVPDNPERSWEADRVQLCAQALVLRENGYHVPSCPSRGVWRPPVQETICTFCTRRSILCGEVYSMPTKLARKVPAVRRSRMVTPGRVMTRDATVDREAVASLCHVDASKARDQMADLLGRVSFGGEHIAVDKHGKPRAVLVPLDDYEHFRWLEDHLDGLEGTKALADYRKAGKKSVSSVEVLRELGIE